MDFVAEFLTVKETAAIIGISQAHAYRLIERGEIPAQHFGRAVRVPRAALDQWLFAINTNAARALLERIEQTQPH